MDFKNPETILVVQIGKIGDMILTTPLFGELRKLFPSARLMVLSGETCADIPLNHKCVDGVIVFRKNIFGNTALIKLLFSKIDLWIDTKDHYSLTGSLLLKTIRPHYSLGFRFKNRKNYFNGILNEYKTGSHSVDINLSPVNFIKQTKEQFNIRPSYVIPGDVSLKFENEFNKQREYILINISAGNRSRFLQKEKWSDLIRRIISGLNYNVIVSGVESDTESVDYILKSVDSSKVKYYKTADILETSELIRRSRFVISPDTSVIHICSAFNVPVIGIYPDLKWNFEKFSPLSEFSEVIFSGNKNNIHDVEPDLIFRKTEEFIKRLNSGNAESRTRVRKEDH